MSARRPPARLSRAAANPAVRAADGPECLPAGDRAREAVADLPGPPVGSMPGIQRIATGGAGAALEGLLLEAYRRGVERGERTGRSGAADELLAWAEKTEPIRPGGTPSARHRTIRACANRVAPEPTDEEMRAALAGVLGGLRDRTAGGELPGAAGGVS